MVFSREDGDGEVVVRNLTSGAETRFPAGSRPTAGPAATPEEEPAAPARNFTIDLSADSKTAVFAVFPTKAETAQAKKDKKPAPTDGMMIVDLASGKSSKVDKVRRFSMPEESAGYLIYLKQSANAASTDSTPKPDNNDLYDQQGGRGGRGGAGGGRGGAGGGRGNQFGSEMVVRALADGAERPFADVLDFQSDPRRKAPALYRLRPRFRQERSFRPETGRLRRAHGSCRRQGQVQHLVWDEKQTQLAFLTDRDDQASKPAKYALYLWKRDTPAAAALVTSATPGFAKDLVISDNGAVSFSRDGKRVFFGAATAAPAAPETPSEVDTDEKAVVELWSYKDDYIQPIQKVRAARDRNRNFTAAYSIADKKVIQLADDSLETVTASEDSGWALGSDDREYRRQDDYGERSPMPTLVRFRHRQADIVSQETYRPANLVAGGQVLTLL